MILRRPAAVDNATPNNGAETTETAQSRTWLGRGTPLRWRLALLTAGMASLAIMITTALTYIAIFYALYEGVDRILEERAVVLLERVSDPARLVNLDRDIDAFKSYNPRMRVSVSLPGWAFSQGDSIPLDQEIPYVDPGSSSNGGIVTSVSTIGDERVLVANNESDTVVVLAQDMTETHELISTFSVVFLIISLLGIMGAVVAGAVVASAGLTPLSKLQRAVDRVTRTKELEPIEVIANDDIAQLTRSFNTMLMSLRESQERQTQLIADAGHELKTPLTSMRTNIELLLMVTRAEDSRKISPQDRVDLKNDVLAQMEEMSTLVGDLMDLTRVDTPQLVTEPVQLDEILAALLERVQRRRPDVTFEVGIIPWQATGDSFALSRALLNLVDNAAKWSPVDGVVRIDMAVKSDTKIRITISDSGPGIKEEDRNRVFERFYRSAEARAMPGSGLGLAIAQQSIVRHGGTISIAESECGGAKVVVDLPGKRTAGSAGELNQVTFRED